MTDKAYIVANEQQEMAVLRIMEQQGYTWNDGDIPTHCIPSHYAQLTFPYVLTNHNFIGWLSIDDARLLNFTVLFDGRKEEQMSDKYVVSQEFMNVLKKWKDTFESSDYVSISKLDELPMTIEYWRWVGDEKEKNNRLIAIIRWVNGEDVFKVEKPKKWVVRSDSKDSEGDYWYVRLDGNEHNKASVGYDIETATRFNTKEEAQEWANSHQEVVQVAVD